MSRASVVAMLVAVEIAIVGIALYAVHGMDRVHAAEFTARTVAPVEAGTSPHIAIDDVDSRIDVSVSNDGLVHVKDLTNLHGAFFGGSGTIAQLAVDRTADGVSISRPQRGTFHFEFGDFERSIEVEVPAGSRLDIARCAGARIAGIEGGIAVHSQDGRITLTDVSGSIEARTDDGSIYATRVRGNDVALASADGRLILDDISAASLDAQTKDGRIEAKGLAISGGAQHAVLHTDDGSIRVALAPGADLTVVATTGDGDVDVDGNSSDDATHRTIRLGNGSGSLQLTSADGSIHILTNGAV